MKETIVFGGGCFWCIEAIFKKIADIKITSGYAGGSLENPNFKEVCTGKTGHAEVIRIKYDEEVTPLKYLLEVFFKVHNPTTLNYQGNDVGTEYRSIILFETKEQEKIIKESIKVAQNNFKEKIVTEVKKLEQFFQAEDEHKNFYEKNQYNPYCRFVILPKLQKFQQ